MAQRFAGVVVDIAKLRDYCLSTTHPRGRHKARVIASRLGLTAEDAPLLRRALLDAVQAGDQDLQASATDAHGQRYVLDFAMTTPVGAATIRSTWMVLTGDDVLRLTSCYLL